MVYGVTRININEWLAHSQIQSWFSKYMNLFCGCIYLNYISVLRDMLNNSLKKCFSTFLKIPETNSRTNSHFCFVNTKHPKEETSLVRKPHSSFVSFIIFRRFFFTCCIVVSPRPWTLYPTLVVPPFCPFSTASLW